jgi:hypothetical protein
MRLGAPAYEHLQNGKQAVKEAAQELKRARDAVACKEAATAFLLSANRIGKALSESRAAKAQVGQLSKGQVTQAKRLYSAAVKLQRRIILFHASFTDRCLR